MTSSSLLTDPHQILAADASVLISLNATGCALEIIRSVPGSFVVTASVFAELERGARKGHNDAEIVRTLIETGGARLVELSDAGNDEYRSLVDGSAEHTLDDGEAATIALAHEVAGVALIDERKARSICSLRFPALAVGSTVDLLIHKAVLAALGREGQIQAIKNALHDARMRVPQHQLDLVIDLIGPDEAANCKSLPRRARGPS